MTKSDEKVKQQFEMILSLIMRAKNLINTNTIFFSMCSCIDNNTFTYIQITLFNSIFCGKLGAILYIHKMRRRQGWCTEVKAQIKKLLGGNETNCSTSLKFDTELFKVTMLTIFSCNKNKYWIFNSIHNIVE